MSKALSRFLARVWRLLMTENQAGEWELSAKVKDVEPRQSRSRKYCMPRSRK